MWGEAGANVGDAGWRKCGGGWRSWRQAACQSRFSSPEIVAVLGDVIRRLRLLKGTRARIDRKGSWRSSRTLS